MKILLLPLALSLLALPRPALAQDEGAAPATPPAINAPAPEGFVDFNAEQSVFDDRQGIGVYTGNVTATQTGEDFILYAQKALSYREPEAETVSTATATKDLRIETRESTIRAEQLYADFKTKVFTLTGSVVISSYGENDGVQTANSAKIRAQNKREPVRIACNRLDWNYDTRQAVLVDNIRIVQGDNVGTCNKIIYDEPKNAARLVGNVRFGNSKRQQFLADELLLFVDSGRWESNTGARAIGPVNNAADGAEKPAPKPVEPFPEPTNIGDDAVLPQAPPDIDKYLPRPDAPKAPPPVIPPEKPAPAAPAEAPKTEPQPAPAAEDATK